MGTRHRVPGLEQRETWGTRARLTLHFSLTVKKSSENCAGWGTRTQHPRKMPEILALHIAKVWMVHIIEGWERLGDGTTLKIFSGRIKRV